MFENLSQIQISGLVALLVSASFLIKSVHNFYLANASKQWPKISGIITNISDFGKKYSLQYEYTVNRTTYKSNRICYTNSNAPINLSASKFEEKYDLQNGVGVYYNPISPKQAVLEPGRKDGLITTIIFLGVLVVFGIVAVFNQTLFLELLSTYFQIN